MTIQEALVLVWAGYSNDGEVALYKEAYDMLHKEAARLKLRYAIALHEQQLAQLGPSPQ